MENPNKRQKTTKTGTCLLPEIIQHLLDIAIQNKKDVKRFSLISKNWKKIVEEVCNKTKRKKLTIAQYITLLLKKRQYIGVTIDAREVGPTYCADLDFVLIESRLESTPVLEEVLSVGCQIHCTGNEKDIDQLKGSWLKGLFRPTSGYGKWEQLEAALAHLLMDQTKDITLEFKHPTPKGEHRDIRRRTLIKSTEMRELLDDPKFQIKLFFISKELL